MSPLDDETLLPQEDEQEMFEHFRIVFKFYELYLSKNLDGFRNSEGLRPYRIIIMPAAGPAF